MKEITLTQGQVALVDDEDFERINKYTWHARPCSKGLGFKAARWVTINGKKDTMFMHHEFLPKAYGLDVDHINGNYLDNTKSNLRYATRSHNNANGRKQRNSTSSVKGVCFVSREKKWRAQVGPRGNTKFLGYFDTEEQAAKVAIEHHKKTYKEFSIYSRESI